MPIAFSCPSCQKDYTVPDQFAGRSTRCRQCGSDMQIPVASFAAPLAAEPAPYGADNGGAAAS